MNEQPVVTAFQCWKCPMRLVSHAPSYAHNVDAAYELGWRKHHGMIWCPACWSQRLPSERWGSRKSPDALE